MIGVANIKLISVVIIFILLLSSFNFIFNSEDLANNYKISDQEIIDNTEDSFKSEIDNNPRSSRGTRSGSVLIEKNEYGGSWLDSFQDDSGIDWGMSDHLKLHEKKIIINISHYLDPSIVALWHLDEGSGSIAYDETPNNNDGSISGASWTTGKFGKALSFDGINDYVNCGKDSSLNLSTNDFTVESWVKVSKTNTQQQIIRKGYGVPTSGQGRWVLSISNTNRVRLVLEDTSGNLKVYIGNKIITDNKWHYICVVFDRSNEAAIYVDGTYDSSTSISSASGSVNCRLPCHIGANSEDNLDYIGGIIDEVCVLKRLRTAQEIKNIYENGSLFGRKLANLTSKQINLPNKMKWDTLIINKTQPQNSLINVTILDASNNQPIPGYPYYNDDGEFDISYINPILYPSIKLNASFEGTGFSTPILYSWGVSWNASNAWRDSLFGGLRGSFQSLTRDEGECWLYASPTDWNKYSNNPILQNGPSSSWDMSGVSFPYIIYNGTGYMMWFTGAGPDARIGLATSPDGMTWTKYSENPVLSVGSGSTWDSNNVASPCVLYDGQLYRMWYQGSITGTNRYNIGYATSTDGINWVKYASNPVLKSSSSGWEQGDVSGPNVIFDGVQFKMYYTGSTLVYNHKIGYATSYDGINWVKHSNNPILSNSTSSGAGVGGLFVIQQNNSYLGWYHNDYDFWAQIYHAYSNDGISWIKSQKNPVIKIGTFGSWDDYSVGSPKVILKNKQYWLYYSGHDGSIMKIGLAKSKFKSTGSITSTIITLPFTGKFDKLIINKTEPAGTFINISILNGSSLLTIPNFENIRGNVIDISSLSTINYPSIILKATFESTGFATPVLYDWSVNWKKNAVPEIIDIFAPTIVNRTHVVDIIVNLSDNEEPEENLTLKVEYRSPFETYWESEYLTQPNFINDKWVCSFTPAIEADLGIYGFRFTCNDSLLDYDREFDYNFIEVRNNLPIIWNINTDQSGSEIYRSQLMKIFINVSDIETPINVLDIKVKYRSIQDSSWRKISSADIFYTQGLWQANFTPPMTAKVGVYEFNIICNDSDSEVSQMININVLNNLPTQPEVTISPDEPRTMDDLIVFAENSFDIETYWKRIKYWYRWYKDDFYMPDYENLTFIPHTVTVKGETWRCVAYPFDSDDLGPYGEASVTIQNTPPELDEPFDEFIMVEDSDASLENKLTQIFSDADADSLIFSVTGQNKINVTISQDTGTIILIPEENWFGTEFITFYANDTVSTAALETVQLVVNPANDLPEIVKVGDKETLEGYPELTFEVDEDDLLHLEIEVLDIDGDVERNMIKYLINISDPDYMSVVENTLIFNPHNEHVGWHYVNISVTDGNETPKQYISQHIKIQVKNTNDPPTVEIIVPMDAQEFLETDGLNFNCIASDIDLLIPNRTEKLIIHWYANGTLLGIGPELINQTFAPGMYNITVEVMDEANENAYDSINIIIKDVPEDKPKSRTTGIEIWFWLLLLIIIIIIVGMLLFVLNTKKKKRLEALGLPADQVLQPVQAYLPQPRLTAAPTIAQSAQLTQPTIAQSQPLIAPTPTLVQPQTQLPPVQQITRMQTETQEQEQRSGIDSKLTPRQKLELLEERLLRGEIDQDVYLNLKAKYEMEAKPYQPLPRLPPPQPPQQPSDTYHQPPPEQITPTQPPKPQLSPQPQVQQPTQEPVKKDKNNNN